MQPMSKHPVHGDHNGRYPQSVHAATKPDFEVPIRQGEAEEAVVRRTIAKRTHENCAPTVSAISSADDTMIPLTKRTCLRRNANDVPPTSKIIRRDLLTSGTIAYSITHGKLPPCLPFGDHIDEMEQDSLHYHFLIEARDICFTAVGPEPNKWFGVALDSDAARNPPVDPNDVVFDRLVFRQEGQDDLKMARSFPMRAVIAAANKACGYYGFEDRPGFLAGFEILQVINKFERSQAASCNDLETMWINQEGVKRGAGDVNVPFSTRSVNTCTSALFMTPDCLTSMSVTIAGADPTKVSQNMMCMALQTVLSQEVTSECTGDANLRLVYPFVPQSRFEFLQNPHRPLLVADLLATPIRAIDPDFPSRLAFGTGVLELDSIMDTNISEGYEYSYLPVRIAFSDFADEDEELLRNKNALSQLLANRDDIEHDCLMQFLPHSSWSI